MWKKLPDSDYNYNVVGLDPPCFNYSTKKDCTLTQLLAHYKKIYIKPPEAHYIDFKIETMVPIGIPKGLLKGYLEAWFMLENGRWYYLLGEKSGRLVRFPITIDYHTHRYACCAGSDMHNPRSWRIKGLSTFKFSTKANVPVWKQPNTGKVGNLSTLVWNHRVRANEEVTRGRRKCVNNMKPLRKDMWQSVKVTYNERNPLSKRWG